MGRLRASLSGSPGGRGGGACLADLRRRRGGPSHRLFHRPAPLPQSGRRGAAPACRNPGRLSALHAPPRPVEPSLRGGAGGRSAHGVGRGAGRTRGERREAAPPRTPGRWCSLDTDPALRPVGELPRRVHGRNPGRRRLCALARGAVAPDRVEGGSAGRRSLPPGLRRLGAQPVWCAPGGAGRQDRVHSPREGKDLRVETALGGGSRDAALAELCRRGAASGRNRRPRGPGFHAGTHAGKLAMDPRPDGALRRSGRLPAPAHGTGRRGPAPAPGAVAGRAGGGTRPRPRSGASGG